MSFLGLSRNGNIMSQFVVGGSTRHYMLRMMYIGQVILSLGFLLLSFAPMLAIAMCGALIAAFGSPMADLILLRMIQTEFHIGKVYSVRMLISIAGLAPGQLLSVPLFRMLALRDAMALCSGGGHHRAVPVKAHACDNGLSYSNLIKAGEFLVELSCLHAGDLS
jgi:hypothetical protein